LLWILAVTFLGLQTFSRLKIYIQNKNKGGYKMKQFYHRRFLFIFSLVFVYLTTFAQMSNDAKDRMNKYSERVKSARTIKNNMKRGVSLSKGSFGKSVFGLKNFQRQTQVLGFLDFFDFSASIGSFDSISASGTAVGASGWDDDTYNSIPIGFTFYYDSSPYNEVAVCTNGWLSFDPTTGSTAHGGYSPNNLATDEDGMRPFVTPLYGDLLVNGDIYYETNGTAPNRIFTIEWNNVAADYMYGDSNSVSFQVILYETTNTIQFVYTPGPAAANTFDNPSGSGLAAGLVDINGNFISLSDLSASATISSTIENDSLYTPPPPGLTFTFTPQPYGVTLRVSDLSYNTAMLNGMVFPQGSSVNVKFLYGTTSGVYTDSINASPYTVSGNVPTPVSAFPTGLTIGTKYYYRIVTISGGNYRQGAERSFMTGYYTAGNTLKLNSDNMNYVSTKASGILKTDTMTVEAWIKPTFTGGSWEILRLISSSVDDGCELQVNPDGSINFNACLGGAWNNITSSGVNADDNKWHHIAGRINGTEMSLYVDGTPVSAAIGTGNLNYNSDVRIFIGRHPRFEVYYSGLIDEVRVWNRVLDSTQIRLDMHRTLTGTEPGLIGYWQLNESTDTTTFDLSAGGNNGTLANFAFDGTDGWRTSTAPFGAGTSANATPFTSGTANLGTVSLTMTNSFDNPVELIATEITASPDSLPSSAVALLSDRYWVITPYGMAGTYSANLTFTVPASFTGNGLQSAEKYQLYHRDDNSDRAWTLLLNTAANVTETTIEFNGITSLSQFMIGSSDTSQPVQVNDFSKGIIRSYALCQNYPNPFNPATTISFSLPSKSFVTLKIYDLLGREVTTLVSENLPAGNYTRQWNATGIPSGVYFYRLRAGNYIKTKKLALIR
jgi:hypothetical protein